MAIRMKGNWSCVERVLIVDDDAELQAGRHDRVLAHDVTRLVLCPGDRRIDVPHAKRADASTLNVVREVKGNLVKMQEQIPPDIKVSFEFDQSPYVTRSMYGVGLEALLGALAKEIEHIESVFGTLCQNAGK